MLPLIAWLLALRRVENSRRARLMVVAGGSYAGLFVILIWQALRGQPLIGPDPLTLAVALAWAVLTVGLAVWPFRLRTARSDADGTLIWINP